MGAYFKAVLKWDLWKVWGDVEFHEDLQSTERMVERLSLAAAIEQSHSSCEHLALELDAEKLDITWLIGPHDQMFFFFFFLKSAPYGKIYLMQVQAKSA